LLTTIADLRAEKAKPAPKPPPVAVQPKVKTPDGMSISIDSAEYLIANLLKQVKTLENEQCVLAPNDKYVTPLLAGKMLRAQRSIIESYAKQLQEKQNTGGNQ